MTGRSVERQLASAKRAEQVVAWRSEGVTFAEIGHRLGVSMQRAYQIWEKALAEAPRVKVQQYRQTQLELIDKATRELLAITADPSVTPRTKVEAWNGLRAWQERLARLTGIDAPTRKEVRVIPEDAIDAEIKKLTAQMEEEAKAAGVDLAELEQS